MGRLIKVVAGLVVIAFLGLVGYSYYPGVLLPDQVQVVKPVTLNVDQ